MLTAAKTIAATTTAGLAGFVVWVQRGLAAHRALVPTVAMARARNVPGEQVNLPDGRKLGYCLPDNFDPSGRVVVYIHGTPECRLADFNVRQYITEHKHPGWYPAIDYGVKRNKELGVQYVPIDRWGVGLSSFKGGGTIADIGADVVALCDHLGVDKFMVSGGSGGGPYTAACAAVIDPARLVGTNLLVPKGPHQLKEQGYSAVIRSLPDWGVSLFFLLQKYAFQRLTAEQLINAKQKDPTCAEKEVMKERGDLFAHTLRKSNYFQHGIAAAVEEHRLLDEENFGFRRCDMGRTLIQAAEGDHNTPFEHAEWYASLSEHVELRAYAGVGHFSIWENLDVLEESYQFIDACFQEHGM